MLIDAGPQPVKKAAIRNDESSTAFQIAGKFFKATPDCLLKNCLKIEC
jgi:hypothetical protein